MQAALEFVARQTGGQALLNSRRAETLAVAASDTRSYYWLGFSPPFKGDDVRHAVKVEVLRPGLAVRSRGNYLDLSQSGEVSLQVESAMLFGNAPGTVPMAADVPHDAGRAETSLTRSSPATPLRTCCTSNRFSIDTGPPTG